MPIGLQIKRTTYGSLPFAPQVNIHEAVLLERLPCFFLLGLVRKQ
jgi:hypothetical protein